MDTISNFLNQLKTSAGAGKENITVRYSGMKIRILKVLKNNGFVVDYTLDKDKVMIDIVLKPGIFTHVKRISKPGQRIYSTASHIPKPLSGYGLVVISTPKGVISGKEAKKLGLGGEVICEIW
jgi:small subunit ribosomal protein S8